MTNPDLYKADEPIQLHPAWQRGYDDRMYGIVENKERDPVDHFAYDAGVRAAIRDGITEMFEERADAQICDLDQRHDERWDI